MEKDVHIVFYLFHLCINKLFSINPSNLLIMSLLYILNINCKSSLFLSNVLKLICKIIYSVLFKLKRN